MKKILAAMAGLLGTVLALSACGTHFHRYTQTIVPSTCRSIGYTLLVCPCGDRQYRDYAALASHEYGEWECYTVSSPISFGEESRACIHCGNLEFRPTAMAEDVPSLFLTSEKGFALVRGTEHTQYQASLRALGGEDGQKPGFILSDIRNGDTVGIDLGKGLTEGIFLDPCTPDYTFARASAANALWQKCRSLHRSELFSIGAPVTDDNTPVVRVFMNGNYAGLYRLLSLGEPLPKNAAILFTASQSDACLFAEPPIFDEDNFLLKDFGGETPDDALRSFGEFSEFVRKSSPQQFREELENYADLTALMDYFILCNFFGLPTGDTAGTVWSTTDGIHWTPSFDSLNNAFGLSAKGYQNAASDGIPPTTSDPNGVIVPYTGKNLLWKKLCAKFPLELRNRYQVLRDTFLTKQNVCDLFLTKFQGINDPLRKLERDLYPALPGTAWASRHVEEYVQTRLLKMDQWLYPIIFSQPS